MAAPAPAPATTLTPRRTLTVFAAVLTVWVTLDQVTKQIAVEHFTTPRDLGIARLVLVRNPNAAFGIPGFPGLFIAVTLLVLVLVVRSLPKVTSLPVTVAYGLVVGGAVGNAIDRVVREPGFPQGAVIDFIHLGPWFPWTFNLADSGITVGAAFLIVLLWRERPEE
jgi:signal peptidase II